MLQQLIKEENNNLVYSNLMQLNYMHEAVCCASKPKQVLLGAGNLE